VAAHRGLRQIDSEYFAFITLENNMLDDHRATLVPGEPLPAIGEVRLYRVQPGATPGRALPAWLEEGLIASGGTAASGRWFSRDRAALLWYGNDQGEAAKPVLVFVDVPAADLEALRVVNQPEPRAFSRDPENEYFVSREIADRREILGAANLLLLRRVRPGEMTDDDRTARAASAAARATCISASIRVAVSDKARGTTR